MTCKDVMTQNPSCCVPSDSVALAAQIMKREDVGPVLVVSDYNSLDLVGILTDRDLALKVVADGRDPHNTRVDEVMTFNPVTCREDDGVSKALHQMADNQVRRIPIVDDNGRLLGIVAQADLARHVDEEDVGEMVEEISQPYGSASTWFSRGGQNREVQYESDGSASNTLARSVAIGALCLGAGAALMYFSGQKRQGEEARTSYKYPDY